MTTTNDTAIASQGLKKVFGEKVAVEDLSLEVFRGEVFGFLGPNGAGKTTSVKMLLGLVGPTEGSAQLLGLPLTDWRIRQRVGFLPEHFRFHDWLSAREFLTLHGRLYQMPDRALKARVAELLDLVGLTPHAAKKLGHFSKGMLQRIGLAQSLLNQPDLVFLDEPTSGLDPLGRRLVRDIIRELRARGTTVFLNSHLLSEVEITCDRVSFVKQGSVVQTSTMTSLMETEFTVDVRARGVTPEVLERLSCGGASNVRRDGEHILLGLTGEDQLPMITRALVEAGAEVYSVTPQRLSLEDLFVKIIGTDGGL